jgi:hypothetical protein
VPLINEGSTCQIDKNYLEQIEPLKPHMFWKVRVYEIIKADELLEYIIEFETSDKIFVYHYDPKNPIDPTTSFLL